MSTGATQPIYSVVQRGPYEGFTKTEMETEWARYKRALTVSGSAVIGTSIGGQSLQFGPRRDWSLDTWGRNIRFALSQVSPDFVAPANQVVLRFGQL